MRVEYSYSLLVLLFIMSPASTAAEGGGRQLSVEEAVSLGQRLGSSDADRSFRVTGTILFGPVEQKKGYQFELRFRSNEQYGMIFRDLEDNTPLLFATNGQAGLYDAASQKIFFVSGVNGEFIVKTSEEGFTFSFGTAEKAHFDIDLKSLISHGTRNRQVARQADGSYIMTSTTDRGNRTVVHIAPESPIPFARVELFNKKISEQVPMLDIRSTSLEQSADCVGFNFPKATDFPAAITGRLEDVPNAEVSASMEVTRRAGASLFFRHAFRHPEARKELEDQIGKINWDAAVSGDKRVSERVRDIVNTAPLKTGK